MFHSGTKEEERRRRRRYRQQKLDPFVILQLRECEGGGWMILDIGPVRFQERVLWYTARELIFQPKLVRKERGGKN